MAKRKKRRLGVRVEIEAGAGCREAALALTDKLQRIVVRDRLRAALKGIELSYVIHCGLEEADAEK